jgi:hypothetical protein
MNLSDIIARVIELSTIVKHKHDERSAAEPLGREYVPFAVRRGPTEAETELTKFLYAQNVAVIYTLVLIMYAGRGDFPIDDFMTQYEEMGDTFDKPDYAVNQMMEKVPLPDYLQSGLDLLEQAGINVDTLL